MLYTLRGQGEVESFGFDEQGHKLAALTRAKRLLVFDLQPILKGPLELNQIQVTYGRGSGWVEEQPFLWSPLIFTREWPSGNELLGPPGRRARS